MIRLAMLLVVLSPLALQAGHGCQNFFRGHRGVGHHQHRTNFRHGAHHDDFHNDFHHAVGENLSRIAAQKYEVANDPEYLEFLKTEARFREFKAYREGLRQGGKNTEPLTNELPIIKANCASCHGTNLGSPRGGLFVGAGSPLEASHITKVMRWLSGKADPPAEMKSVIEKLIREKQQGAALEELLTLEGEDE